MGKDYNLKTTPVSAQRRAEYAQDDEWIEDFLRRAPIGHIATRWDGQPFITPTLFWYDHEREAIYFHSNVSGRVRANAERHPEVCFEACEMGKLLPSNVALEFSIQYESVMVFGAVSVLDDDADKRRALQGLLEKYFPGMQAGRDYRPITDAELKRTSVYAVKIESWSGKRNWVEQAEQSAEWPALAAEWLG